MIKSILLAILVFYPFAGAFLCLLAGKRVPGRKEITAEKNGLVRDLLADFVTVSEFLLVLVLAAATAGTANNAPAHTLWTGSVPDVDDDHHFFQRVYAAT